MRPDLLRACALASILALIATGAARAESIVVSVDSTEIKAGDKTVGRADKGQRFEALETRGDWYRIEFRSEGARHSGWIRRKDVRVSPPVRIDALTASQKARLDSVMTHYNEFARLDDEGKYREALVPAREALAITREFLGEDHIETAKMLNNMANALDAVGEFADAKRCHEQALATLRRHYGDRHAVTATSLNNLGTVLSSLGDYRQARSRYEEALSIRRQVLGEKHIDTASTLENLAMALQDLGDHAAARRHYEQVLAARKELLGPRHRQVAKTLSNLGTVAHDQGDLPLCRKYHEQALEIRRETLGEKHPLTAMSLGNLGLILEDLGEYAAARRHHERALAIRREMLGDNHPETASSLNNIGSLLGILGETAESVRFLEQSLAIKMKVYGEKHPDTARALNNLGNRFTDLGDLPKARALHERALLIRRETLGVRHPETAMSLLNLGIVLSELGDYEGARRRYEESLGIKRETLGEKHIETTSVLGSLGNVLSYLHDYESARGYYEEALAIRRETLGEKHADTAGCLHNLAGCLSDMGEKAEARRLYEEALAIERETLGEKHADVARTLHTLAGVLRSLGEADAARVHAEQALALRRETSGEGSPDTGRSHRNIGLLHLDRGEIAEAAAAFDRERRILRDHATRVLPGLSPREQLRFLSASSERALHIALSFALAHRDDPAIARISAEWLLNGKGTAEESLSERARLIREATEPATSERIRELLAVRGQLSQLSLKSVAPAQREEHHRRTSTLEAREAELSRQLGQSGADASRRAAWTDLDQVRGKIPDDSLLIDVARISVYDLRPSSDKVRRTLPVRYVAWLIPAAGAGDVRMVDLGEAGAIDEAVRSVRLALADAPKTTLVEGEPDSERAFRKPLDALAKLVLAPLRGEIGERRRLILTPDASLWLVPWQMLPVADDRYAIEDFEIRYVTCGRDLLRRQAALTEAPPAIFADPDFDAPPASSPAGSSAALGAFGRLPLVKRLPGTAAEAQAVVPSVETWTGGKPAVFLGGRAAEPEFRSVRRPSVLALCTHGFFLEDQPTASDGVAIDDSGLRSASLSDSGQPIENPLLRCGLLLAGCNRREEARTGDEDGVLTGMEIVGADLRGTRLVVLSACETGLGDVRNGEGVAGLRQAFHLAGAESVVGSLWSVPDADTARLMADFFKALAAGKERGTALREAQLGRLASHRERTGGGHPFYWAAFTLTGTRD